MRPDPTDLEIKEAYRISKMIARNFTRNHHIAFLDLEDYIQEGVMGWLEGRNIYHAIIDAFRKAAPIDKMAYRPGMEIPETVHFGIHLPEQLSQMSHDPISTLEKELDSKDLIDQILDATHQLPEKIQFCVLGSYYYGMTLSEVGDTLGVTVGMVSRWRTEGVSFLRQYFKDKDKEKEKI